MKLDRYTVPDTEFNVICNMSIGSTDLSGETSNTQSTFNGIKAKILNVKFQVGTDDTDLIQHFMQVAEAVENDDLKVYTIVDDLADALNINQVTFYENVKVGRVPDFEAISIVFKLKEHISPSEKNEAKADTTTVQNGQSSTGQATDNAETPKPAQAIPPELSAFEKFLKKGDALAKEIADEYFSDNDEKEESKT